MFPMIPFPKKVPPVVPFTTIGTGASDKQSDDAREKVGSGLTSKSSL